MDKKSVNLARIARQQRKKYDQPWRSNHIKALRCLLREANVRYTHLGCYVGFDTIRDLLRWGFIQTEAQSDSLVSLCADRIQEVKEVFEA